MGKVVFYEERDFQGRSYACEEECPDLYPFFRRCNSCRVESGGWMLYERPHFSGYQYFLRAGEYPDYQRWMGFNDCVRSCRVIPMHHGNHRIRMFEHSELGGQMMELTDDCPSLSERFHRSDVYSCDVVDGHWVFYEHPGYRGCQYLLRPGEYRRFNEWGSMTARMGSVRRASV